MGTYKTLPSALRSRSKERGFEGKLSLFTVLECPVVRNPAIGMASHDKVILNSLFEMDLGSSIISYLDGVLVK